MKRVILRAPRKHGVPDDDILHAYRIPIRVFDLDDLTMLVGPSQAGDSWGSGSRPAEGIDFVVCAMPARASFLE